MVTHERLTAPRVTIELLLAKPRSFLNLHAFLELNGRIKFNIIDLFFLLKITLVDYRSTDSSVYSDLFRNFYHITNRYNTKIASTGVYRRPWKFSPSVSNIKRYIKININIYQTLYTKL